MCDWLRERRRGLHELTCLERFVVLACVAGAILGLLGACHRFAEMRVFSPAEARLIDWMACLSAVGLIDSSTAIDFCRHTIFPPIISLSH
jgi:hypothetical protein